MRKVEKLSLISLLCAVSIILTRFAAINIPLGGFPSLSIELGGIPLIFGGIVLGPLYALIGGLVTDLVGFVINNRGGVYHPGFTLNTVLTALIPALLYKLIKSKKINDKVILGINYSFLTIITTLAIYYLVNNVSNSQGIEINATWRIILIILAIITYLILMVVITYLHIKHRDEQKLFPINKLIFIVMAVEVLVYISLTPIWIYGLYGIPSVFSILSRVFRALFMIPIKASILYIAFNSLSKTIQTKFGE
ncbi:MAG: folate family ECF transporter S component [Bacilli bacterium]|nr:folate family ECF transporter S component [Bacilli bacterium]